jgi:hypothetical protein
MGKSGNRTAIRVLVLAAVAALAVAAYLSGLTRYLTLDALKSGQAALGARVAEDPALAAGAYFGLYVLVTALSIPGAAIMTLAGAPCSGWCKARSWCRSRAASARRSRSWLRASCCATGCKAASANASRPSSGRRARRRVLPVHAAARAGVPVLP